MDYLTYAWAGWLISNAFSFEYDRVALFRNDLVSGLLLIINTTLILVLRKPILRWVNAAIGVWLTFAPLLYWASSPAVYSDDTLIGTLIIGSSVIMPSILNDRSRGSDTPNGWSYNPSSWPQRLPIIALAFLGFFLARYLAAFQLGHISRAWDPFFGNGTETILRSDVSKWFPVSDAGLGAFSYLLDAIAGAIGGTRRWRSMPWIVVLFGFMVIPPGVTSIVLVILQPVAVGAWCTICLVTAFVMLLMVPPALDEVLASFQFLKRVRREGRPLWRAFWYGDDSIHVPEVVHLPRPGSELALRMPWNIVASTLVGVWLLFAPTVLGYPKPAADLTHFSGALAATFAVIAFAEVGRPARLLNILVGLVLAGGSWFVAGGNRDVLLNSHLSAFLLVVLSFRAGEIRQTYGEFDRWIRVGSRKKAPHEHSRAA